MQKIHIRYKSVTFGTSGRLLFSDDQDSDESLTCEMQISVKQALTEASSLACSLKSRVPKKKKKGAMILLSLFPVLLPDPNATACKEGIIYYRLPFAASTPDCVPIHKTK